VDGDEDDRGEQAAREFLSRRTKEGLERARQRGARLGRPSSLPADVVGRIVRQREAGRTLQAIADGLNADEVPTAQGGRQWYPSTVAAVLRSAGRGQGR
jgi:DNA invertase Pin-like site-specific DNA recombinase